MPTKGKLFTTLSETLRESGGGRLVSRRGRGVVVPLRAGGAVGPGQANHTRLDCRRALRYPGEVPYSDQLSSGVNYEKDLPAQGAPAQASPRIPAPHAHPGGTGGAPFPPEKRPQASGCLIATFQPLRTSQDFALVFSHGKRRRVGGITVHCLPGEPDRVRIGLVAGRKVGKAVVRNRVKRRLRAALTELDGVSGGDYVIVATGQVAQATFPTLLGWLRSGLGGR